MEPTLESLAAELRRAKARYDRQLELRDLRQREVDDLTAETMNLVQECRRLTQALIDLATTEPS